MQIQINKFLVLLMTVILFAAAGCSTDTSQNNGMGSNNQDASNRNTAAQSPPQDTSARLAVCTGGVDDKKIQAVIGRLPRNIREQFAAGGSVSYELKNSGQVLIFKGYIRGAQEHMRDFFREFDAVRGKYCVKEVTFQGNAGVPNFELRLTHPADPNSCSVEVEDVIRRSGLNKQHRDEFDTSEVDKVLTFTGRIYDEKEHVKKLADELQPYLSRGCVTTIVLARDQSGRNTRTITELPDPSEPGFSWMICDPLVECNGECKPSCGDGNKNTDNGFINTNTGNANTNR